jgi:hypothetical protein
MKSIATAALLLAAAPQPVDAPLAPTGKWVVEYADAMCILSHDYGVGDAKVTLGFRPWPMGSSTEIVLITAKKPYGPSFGDATVTLFPDRQPIKGSYASWPSRVIEKGVATVTVDQKATSKLADAEQITIKIGGRPAISVAPSGMSKALAALKTCTDDLLAHWGVDPAEAERIVTPAKGNPLEWITTDDYPSAAVNSETQGTTAMFWQIGTDGAIEKCTIVGPSGSPLLDAAACSALRKRGRYTPALDKDGKPVISHASRRVVWRLY